VNRFTLVNKERIRNLQPAYFALVMATSIVAIACQLEHLGRIAELLTGLNSGMFVILTSLTLARLTFFRREVHDDIMNHARAPGFLTIAAGSALLGCEFILIAGRYRIAFVLWIAGIVSWIFLTYTIFATFTVKESKPTLDQGINGGWLLAVVSTQAVAQLALLLIPMFPGGAEVLLFLGLALWLWGGMLYIWMISLIFYRYTFFTFAPSDLMPPYWINMGAVAISTLAGAALLDRSALSPIVMQLAPFVMGLTLLFWAIASFWIPLLVVLEVWSHLIRGLPFAYSPLSWGGVFPLGMYSVCTYRLARTLDAPFLAPVSEAFMAVALVAWIAAFTGLVHSRLHLPDPSRSAAEDGDGR